MSFACVLNWCTLPCCATQRTQTATTSYGIGAYKSAGYSIQSSNDDDAFSRKIIIILWILGTYAARRKSVWSIHEWNEWTLRVCNVSSVFRWGRAPNTICRTSAIKNNLTLDANSTFFQRIFSARIFILRSFACLQPLNAAPHSWIYLPHSALTMDAIQWVNEWHDDGKKNNMMRLKIVRNVKSVSFSLLTRNH